MHITPQPLVRFRDLKERKIVGNRVTLWKWIRNQGFPPGRLLGPNTRAWTEAEISEWLASRPVSNAGDEAA
jgi:predicted DNA-binding transcriptional regulator AlpA